jgi:hypothetical protein
MRTPQTRLTLPCCFARQNHLDEFFAMVNFANPVRPCFSSAAAQRCRRDDAAC